MRGSMFLSVLLGTLAVLGLAREVFEYHRFFLIPFFVLIAVTAIVIAICGSEGENDS